MKQLRTKSLALLSILLSTVFFGYVYAVDTTYHTFDTQSATGLGSNNSVISTENYPRPSGSGAYYINKGNNSSIIGNYFEGYYYDSVYGYFEFDWSNNQNENVRIVGSTSLCSDSYGYKLGGYAYSPAFGFIDFDYDDTIFVYYCEDEGFMRGYAYNGFIGYQNFEGIEFDIGTAPDVETIPPTQDEQFVDSPTEVDDNSIGGDTNATDSNDPRESVDRNSNFTRNTIQNDKFEFDVRVESSFYIIK